MSHSATSYSGVYLSKKYPVYNRSNLTPILINFSLFLLLDEAYSEHGTPSKMSDSLFDGLSWADQIDLEEQLLESRYPGRAIQLHEKLSSPARKREPQEAFKVHQEKQKNAKMRRLKFQDEKATKLSALNARIEEVIAQVCVKTFFS